MAQSMKTIRWARRPKNSEPWKAASDNRSSHTRSHNQWTTANSPRAQDSKGHRLSDHCQSHREPPEKEVGVGPGQDDAGEEGMVVDLGRGAVAEGRQIPEELSAHEQEEEAAGDADGCLGGGEGEEGADAVGQEEDQGELDDAVAGGDPCPGMARSGPGGQGGGGDRPRGHDAGERDDHYGKKKRQQGHGSRAACRKSAHGDAATFSLRSGGWKARL